jgi:hypothetical protein
LLPIYAKDFVVTYVVLPSFSSSPVNSSPHGGSVLQYINHEVLDFVSSISLKGYEN